MLDILLALDLADNYAGTAFEGLDPFERQLRRFEIVKSHEEGSNESVAQRNKKNTKQA